MIFLGLAGLHRHSRASDTIHPAILPVVTVPQPQIPAPEPFTPILRQGGKNMQDSCKSYMSGQLRGQGQISLGTLLHEATHMLNARLDMAIGGDENSPSRTYCAFYLWNENRYLVIPTAGFAKILVAPRVPLDTVSRYNYNNYFGPMFASRDAVHVIEDFDAELNGFEADSPALLRDMLVFSVALGLEMQQRNDGRLREYQAGDKFLIERAVQKQIDLSAFRASTNPKALALKTYLQNTYGKEWVGRVLGF